jgi:hypothetical protein
MYQLLVPGKLMVSPSVSFAEPVTLDALGLQESRDINQIKKEVIKKAQEQFLFHSNKLLAACYIYPSSKR